MLPGARFRAAVENTGKAAGSALVLMQSKRDILSKLPGLSSICVLFLSNRKGIGKFSVLDFVRVLLQLPQITLELFPNLIQLGLDTMCTMFIQNFDQGGSKNWEPVFLVTE